MSRVLTRIKDELQNVNDNNIAEYCFGGLAEEKVKAFEDEGNEVYSGKVRDVVFNKNKCSIIHSDKLSAFDKHIGLVPYKGVILKSISEFWFKIINEFVPTHYLGSEDERTLNCLKLTPLKVEVIVRGYLAGSMLRAYKKGERVFCGVELPDNLRDYQQLPKAIITPTTKAEVYEKDEDTTVQELIDNKIVTKRQWAEIEEYTFAIFSKGQEIYQKCGWIIADSKYEFGVDENGKIYLIDEVHTPDSSRLWELVSYESQLKNNIDPIMLDKEVVRRYLIAQGFMGEGDDIPQVPTKQLVELAKNYLVVADALQTQLH